MASKGVFTNEFLANLAAEIIRETIRNGGDAKLAIEPYSDEVKALVAGKLTHSERKAAGLATGDDPLEMALRAQAENRESFYLGLRYNPFRRLVGTDALGYYLALHG